VSLWLRQVTFQVGQPGQKGRSVSGLRVSFQVEMSRSRTPNKAKIEVYNPAPETIAEAQKDGAVVVLYVGYDVPQAIFTGAIAKNGVQVEKAGTDRKLKIEAQDGLAAYQAAQVNVSFAAQTSLAQVLEEVATQLGLPRGSLKTNSSMVLTQGAVLAGPAREVLDRLARAQDADWFIRDGTLQVVGKEESTGETAIVFSSSTRNLIGSPTAGKGGRVQFVGLISPTLRPGKPVRLASEAYQGDYTAEEVTFEGDSMGGPFYVKVVARPR
jgi:hypothetical protein